MRFPQGHVIGKRFVIDAWVGEGCMASVYRAQDQQTGETVAHRSLGRALMAQGTERLPEARAEIEESIRIFEQSGIRSEAARARRDLAALCRSLGDDTNANALENEAHAILDGLDG